MSAINLFLGPLDLVATLFSSSACSYRIESYWTYEVCHGNYIKQYHEERDKKISKVQEYYLGKWNKINTEKLREKLAEAERNDEKLKYKKIDGLRLPYLELEMTDGTQCDLINNKPRVTRGKCTHNFCITFTSFLFRRHFLFVVFVFQDKSFQRFCVLIYILLGIFLFQKIPVI